MLAKQTILLVEDSCDDSLVFQAAAIKVWPGATVLQVNTAEEAIHYFEGAGKYADRKAFPLPTMAFIDLALPDMSGQDLVKWIRKQPQFKRLLVAVITGTTDVHIFSELYRWGADSFVLKTSNNAELVLNLSELTAYWSDRGLMDTSPPTYASSESSP